jgi:cell fate (sporulation/competence/biofilm development) regulator YlbF (YheA/YmcA/DUF963 family)
MRYFENLNEAERLLKTSDHLIYVSYTLLKDQKLLIKILPEIKIAISKTLNAVLQNEYILKRIKLYKNPKDNFETFKKKCAPLYKITNSEISKIEELFKIVESHEKSPMEFTRGENVVILSDTNSHLVVNFEKTKEFLQLGKLILEKVRAKINEQN